MQFSLRPLPLPSFDEHPLNWKSFRDLFTFMVIKAPRVSESRKLLHLQDKVAGKAAELIKLNIVN